MTSPIAPALVLLAAFALPGFAQQTLDAPPPSIDVVFHHDSGAVANNTGLAQVVIAFPITVTNAPWMRLYFEDVLLAGDPLLGTGSILRLTSLFDAEVQELDARGVRQWTSSSAYFNGDTVLVEVLAQPGTGPNRVVVDRATAGMPIVGTDAPCGIDNRVASFDGRNARLLPAGCTAWMIADCKSCFLSAGHCVGGGMVVQYNVPLSGAGGQLNHPPIEDQFPADAASLQFQNSGVGFDWAYFGTTTNNLGQTAFEHQLARWSTDVPPPFNNQHVIRVTGYGVDVGTANQTQQTVTGNWTGLAANHSTYSTYVEGGNSGSAMIHELLGLSIGIVTHTSCINATTQQNYATRWTQASLQAALANPLGVCAGTACNSVGTPYCPTGPLMSVISATGSASIAANDLVLHANNIPVNKLGLFLYARNAQSVPFGVSSLCVGGAGFPVRRLPTVSSGAGTTLTFALDQSALPAGDVFLSGEEICFQAWFRVSTSANETSNGLKVVFQP